MDDGKQLMIRFWSERAWRNQTFRLPLSDKGSFKLADLPQTWYLMTNWLLLWREYVWVGYTIMVDERQKIAESHEYSQWQWGGAKVSFIDQDTFNKCQNTYLRYVLLLPYCWRAREVHKYRWNDDSNTYKATIDAQVFYVFIRKRIFLTRKCNKKKCNRASSMTEKFSWDQFHKNQFGLWSYTKSKNIIVRRCRS